MKISITVFNDPTKLGKDKKRKNVKTNYAFFIHDGVPEHTGVKFTSWSKYTKGQIKAYKTPVHRKKRDAIPYFVMAIEKIQPKIIDIIKDRIEFSAKGIRIESDLNGLKEAWLYIGMLIKEEARNIIRSEAYDTGDLMASVENSNVTVEG